MAISTVGMLDQSAFTYNKFYGIFIGIEKFHQSEGQIKSLFHSNEDAVELSRFFLKANKAEKKPADITVFIDRDHLKKLKKKDQLTITEGTRSNILSTLTQYLHQSKADDLLLLFISTHGEIDYNDYFFVPGDGNINNILGTGISSSTLIQALSKASGKGVKVLMIIDTCFSGAIGFDVSKYKGAFSCLLSSSPVEYSYEFFDIEHGIFTYYLLEGLKGHAMKGNQLTLGNLFDYVYQNVQQKTQKRQNPLLMGTLSHHFILYATGPEPVSMLR